MFDDKLWQILEFSNIEKRGIKISSIEKFLDPAGGTWIVGSKAQAPCGCLPESGGNGYRLFMWCPTHLQHGVLFYQYSEGKWCWTDGVVEVKR